ncbi:hypothetical protein BDV19DRAFT_394376 [Aspergillus venezuelensis]
MADSATLWAQALESLTEEDRTAISAYAKKLHALDDIIASAKAKEAESIKRRWTYKRRDGTRGDLHSLFGRVAEKMTVFKGLCDSVAALDPVHMAVPWAVQGLGIQVCVCNFIGRNSTTEIQQKAGKYFEHFELAHEGLQRLTILVPRYTVFENLYLQEDFQIKLVLQGELVRLYSPILKFTAGLKRYYKVGTARRIVGSLTMSFDELEEVMSGIKAQQVIVEDLARLTDAERARDAASKASNILKKALEKFDRQAQYMHEGMADLVRNMKRAEEQEILDWFSPVSYDRHHQSLRINRLEGSGLWVFAEAHYKKWRSANESAILWLRGQPGTGKSTLMSLIIDSNLGPEAITRSIIKQISRVNPNDPIRGAAIRRYQDIHQEGRRNKLLAFPDTRDLVLDLTGQGTTMVFIDAVDECNSDQQRELFSLIPRLLHEAKGTVKILIFSRPSSDIAGQVNRYQESYIIEIGQDEEDTRRFADLKATECVDGMKLRQIPVPDSLQVGLTEHLVRGAQGMFLWVKLQIDVLNDPRQTSFEHNVLERVRKTPRGLSAVYSSIYQQIQEAGSTVREIAFIMF